MEVDQDKIENFLVSLRPELHEKIMQYFGETAVSRKGEGVNDIFTEADTAAQEIIVSAIKKQFPDHGIISEEQDGHYQPEASCQWFIDPIDGTKNFATGVPLFGSMAALIVDGYVEIAMDYLPATDELYIAKRNRGVTNNGMPIHCSSPKDFKSSYGIGPVRAGGGNMIKLQRAITEVEPKGIWMNCIGSPAISAAYLASGKRDWFYSKGSKSWDYMASALVIKESGCVTLDADGEDWKAGDLSLVACAPEIEKEIRQIIEVRKRLEAE